LKGGLLYILEKGSRFSLSGRGKLCYIAGRSHYRLGKRRLFSVGGRQPRLVGGDARNKKKEDTTVKKAGWRRKMASPVGERRSPARKKKRGVGDSFQGGKIFSFRGERPRPRQGQGENPVYRGGKKKVGRFWTTSGKESPTTRINESASRRGREDREKKETKGKSAIEREVGTRAGKDETGAPI